SRAFAAGDVVELELPMQPRFTAPDPRIDAVRGCLTVERGPEVFALESVDLVGAGASVTDVADVVLDAAVPPREADGQVLVRVRSREAGAKTVEVPLVPYHEWAERGPSTMRVWIPTT
ncbi:MAG: glycoside hydrolase family 127 protein, partial [Actinomycetota bacterium]|nr:glycoside hydrolase family 127 protein [Actinomycetota bacterium]